VLSPYQFRLYCPDIVYSRLKYTFRHRFKPQNFLSWNEGQLKKVKISKEKKVRGEDTRIIHSKTTSIPLLYVQIIAQLLAEDEHGDFNQGHEALRRGSYARQVLAAVAREIRVYTGPNSDFRSKVLNPILQRYLRGIPDNYTPAICTAISGDKKTEPTIGQVTTFYLALDPTDPTFIHDYRRNLIYLTEPRWYLGILLGNYSIKDVSHFNRIQNHHDKVMVALRRAVKRTERTKKFNKVQTPPPEESDYDSPLEPPRVPRFSKPEIEVIVDEHLEGWFKKELNEVVGASLHVPTVINRTLQEDLRSLALKRRDRTNRGGKTNQKGKGRAAPQPQKKPRRIETDEDDDEDSATGKGNNTHSGEKRRRESTGTAVKRSRGPGRGMRGRGHGQHQQPQPEQGGSRGVQGGRRVGGQGGRRIRVGGQGGRRIRVGRARG
jgi:hypothetical protein